MSREAKSLSLAYFINKVSSGEKQVRLSHSQSLDVYQVIIDSQADKRDAEDAVKNANAAIERATQDIRHARLERDIARAERNDLVVLLANQPQTAP